MFELHSTSDGVVTEAAGPTEDPRPLSLPVHERSNTAVQRRASTELPATLGSQLDARLSRLLRSLGKAEHLSNARRVVKQLTHSWADEPVGAHPAWASDITDDHSPFELSLALNGRETSARILTEPQDVRQPSLAASWRLASDIHETLRSQWGADFAEYEAVAGLFEPTSTSEAVFGIWHSAVLGRRHDTQFKVYLNPAIHGAADAERVVAEAMARLGLTDAWRALRESALQRPGLDQAIYFSLDLTRARDARAKVYVAHRHATSRDLAAALAQSPGFDPEDVSRWLECLLGGTGPFQTRPPITCFAFNRDSLDLHTTTLHLPVRCHAADDFEVARQVCKLLSFPQRVSYMRALTGVAERPLESGPGLQTYVSLRPSPGKQAVTVYLAPQLYSGAPSRTMEAGLMSFAGLDEPRAAHRLEHRAPA